MLTSILQSIFSVKSVVRQLFLIFRCVPDPKQDTVGVTFAAPDAAACENTMWASPRFSEASGSELLQHERTAGLGKKPAAAAGARVRRRRGEKRMEKVKR